MKLTNSPASSREVSRSREESSLLFYAITICSLTALSLTRYPHACVSVRECECGALKPRKEFYESWYKNYVSEGEETQTFYRFFPILCSSVCLFDVVRLQRKRSSSSSSCRSRRIFQGEKILSTLSFGREVKPFVSCRLFAACKRTRKCVRGSRSFRSKLPAISRPSSSSFHY